MKRKIITLFFILVVLSSIIFGILHNHKLYNDPEMKIYEQVYILENNKEILIDTSDLRKIEENSITFTIYMNDVNEDDIVHFYTKNSTAKFYNNATELEFTYDSNQNLYEVKLAQNTSFTAVFDDCENGLSLNKIFICDSSQFSSYLLVKNSLYITLILVSLFSSIIIVSSVLLYSLLKRNVTLFFGYTVLFILLSVWCLTQVDYFQYIFANYIDLHEISTYVSFLLPVGILIASQSIVCNKPYKKYYQVLLILLSVLSAIMLVFHTFEVVNLVNLVNLWFLLSIILLIGLAIISYYTDRSNENKDNKLILQSTIVLLLGMIIECIIAVVDIQLFKGLYITLSLLVVFTISLNSIILNYVKSENNRRFLSEENERLTSSILLSQIKPHFLYNALNSISYLCKKNPQQADIAVVKFSRYLRQNMKSIEDTDMIDFTNEVEHIKNYLYLEQIRFPNIEFKFEIMFDDFEIPPLCIQPIVENSVKHGASKNPDGGFVSLKSFKTEKYIIIEVLDNGIGFDDQKIIKGTGLSNISRRFAMHLNADVEFQSQIGKGTVVRVKIPRRDIE